MFRILPAAAVLLVLCAGPVLGRTWYVHPDSALSSIQAGLDSCAAVDTVLVGPGTYPGGYTWPQVAGISVIGARGPDSTVIDGEHYRSGFYLFFVPGQSSISGFTIHNCYTDPVGAGVAATECTLDITDCLIAGNAARGGGGIACEYGRYAVRRCRVSGNETLLYPPGGIDFGNGANALVESCTVTDNWGGGIGFTYGDSTIIRYCNISGNHGAGVGYGGASGWIANARYNWWGDASGPYHPTLNPLGRGDTVGDYVDFEPWLTGPVGVEETTNGELRMTNASPTVLSGIGLVEAYDITGRRATEPKTGVYFMRASATSSVRKVILVR